MYLSDEMITMITMLALLDFVAGKDLSHEQVADLLVSGMAQWAEDGLALTKSGQETADGLVRNGA